MEKAERERLDEKALREQVELDKTSIEERLIRLEAEAAAAVTVKESSASDLEEELARVRGELATRADEMTRSQAQIEELQRELAEAKHHAAETKATVDESDGVNAARCAEMEAELADGVMVCPDCGTERPRKEEASALIFFFL